MKLKSVRSKVWNSVNHQVRYITDEVDWIQLRNNICYRFSSHIWDQIYDGILLNGWIEK